MARKRVLVIDDDPGFRNLIEDALSGDFEVSGAKDWNEGMQACRGGKADVLLVDFVIPRVNGLKMVRALARSEVTRRIPVVVVTASYLDSVTRRALSQANVRRTVDKLAGVRAVRQALMHAAPIG